MRISERVRYYLPEFKDKVRELRAEFGVWEGSPKGPTDRLGLELAVRELLDFLGDDWE